MRLGRSDLSCSSAPVMGDTSWCASLCAFSNQVRVQIRAVTRQLMTCLHADMLR